MGIIIYHYKDPNYTTSIMESSKVFFCGSFEKEALVDQGSLNPANL